MSAPDTGHRPLWATWTLVSLVLTAYTFGGLVAWREGVAGPWDAGIGPRSEVLRVWLGGQHDGRVMFGDGWRLVTSVLVHVDVVHVLVNALAMVALGRLGESRVGAGAWSACFWLGGLVGSLASYAAGVAQSDGASGAIFAWLALVAVQASGAQGERSTHLVSARMLWAVIVGNLVLGLLVPAIDVIAHVGGLCAGLLWAFILTKPWASIVGPGVNLCAGLVVVYGLGMCWGAA